MSKELYHVSNEKGVPLEQFSEALFSTITSKGQVTIPAKVRDYINAKPGDKIQFSINEDNQVIVDVLKRDSLLDLFGSMPPKEKNPEEWSVIRKNAREEFLNSSEI